MTTRQQTDTFAAMREIETRRVAAQARADRLYAERAELHRSLHRDGATPNAGQETRLDDLLRAFEKASDEAQSLAQDLTTTGRAGSPAEIWRDGVVPAIGADPRETAAPGAPTVGDARALRTIDDAFRAGQLPDHAAEKATALLAQGTPTEQGLAARWATAAGDPLYRSAFAKLLADPTHGHLTWTGPEGDAYRAVAAVHGEMNRAMSTTPGAGGFMIPLSLDPAIMLTSDGSNNPLRRLASVRQTLTNSWTGVTSAGATSEWKAEPLEVADGSPALGNPVIPVFFGDSFVPYSFEVGDDAVNFLDELTIVLRDSADNLQATAYTTGTGVGQPQGIVTGLAGTASEINTTGTEAIVASDAYALQNALPARFSANATWQSHIAIANTFRQFETTSGALKFPGLHETPPTLLGKPWHENSNMDGAINAAVTANNYVLIYGDVAKGFFIVDRVGSTLELQPHLFGANGRPTGQRGALLWFRTGSEVVVPQALRMLDVPTTV